MADIDIKIQIQAAQAAAQLAKFTAQVEKAKLSVERAQLQNQKLKNSLDNAGKAGTKASKGFFDMSRAVESFVGNLAANAVSSAFSALKSGFASVIELGKDFEEGLIQIAKTTGLSEDGIKQFGAEIEKIGQRIPIATSSLLDIAKVAGQLGIQGQENLAAFTETMAKLQLATDIAGEEGSQNVAKILQITGELEENGSENINKFGSVITELGNNFAATESQILSVAKEIAKGTATFKLSSEDVLGLATAFKVSGTEAEAAGTTIQQIFKKIGEAVQSGGEPLERFAEASNLTTEAFAELFRSDPTQAFAKLTEGLGKAGLSGSELNAEIKKLGFSNARVLKSLGPLVAQYGTLQKSINSARKEAEEKTALDRETEKAQEALTADLTKLNNSFTTLANTIFTAVAPALKLLVQAFTGIINFLAESPILLSALTAALTVAGVSFASVAASILVASGAFAAIATAATAAWAAITGPIGLAVIGIAAITPVILDVVDAFSNMQERTEDYLATAKELDEAYQATDKEGQEFLSTLNELTGGMEETTIPLQTMTKEFEALPGPMGRAGDVAIETADKIVKAAKKVLLFEQEKTEGLKKFFKEEEAAKLESTFKILESEKEKEQFLKFVASEGSRRQSEAFKATIGLDRATIDSARKKQAEMEAIRQQELTQLVSLQESKEALLLAEEEAKELRRGNDQIFRDEELIKIQEFFTAEEEAAIQAKLNLETNEIEKQKLITDAKTQGIKNRQKLEKENIMEMRKFEDEYTAFKKKEAKQREQNTGDTLSKIATLSRSGNKELAAIGKAAAVAQIAIDTPKAIAAAIGSNIPYPGNLIAAGAVAVAMAAQAAAAAGANIGGFEQGGIVPGSSFSGDNLTANVNSGEMILNRQQQSNLFKLAQTGGQAKGSQEIVTNITVELDGEVVGEAVSKQVANGLVLGEVQ